MPEFSYNIRVDPPVDPALHKAFTELCNGIQNAMVRISHEHSRVQERCNHVEEESERLRRENEKLQREVGRLQAEVNCQNGQRDSNGSRRSPQDSPEESFKLLRTVKIHDAPVHSVTMGLASKIGTSSDMVATASWDATVKLYSLGSQKVVRTLGTEDHSTKMSGLYSVAFAKTRPEVLGCTSCDKSVYLWNHQTGQLLSKLSGHTDEVNGIDFHCSQQVMCTASDDCKAIIWDFQEGLTLRTLEKHKKAVYGATFLGQEHQFLVATCSFDQKVRVFDMRDRSVAAELKMHTDDVIGIDYTTNKQCLGTSSDDGLVCLWDCRTWKIQQSINTKESPGMDDCEVKRIAFSPSGDSLAAACSSGRVLVYDISTFPATQLASLGGHTDCSFDVTWGVCPETRARLLVSASHDHTCNIWREV